MHGGEANIDRTLRLLYVTCSRAEESLALVFWGQEPGRGARCNQAVRLVCRELGDRVAVVTVRRQ
jgi:hypothetical protein